MEGFVWNLMKPLLFFLLFFQIGFVFSQNEIPEKAQHWKPATLSTVPSEWLGEYWANEMLIATWNLRNREAAQWENLAKDTLIYKRFGVFLEEKSVFLEMQIGYEWVVETQTDQWIGTALDLVGILGYFQPNSRGLALSKVPISPVLVKTTIEIWRNGKLLTEEAYRIGNLGHPNSPPYRKVVQTIQKGGNYIITTKEKALELLKNSFQVMPDETGRQASRAGYRIDNFVENAEKGLKQGHQGLHINYYDKGLGVKGTFLIID